MNLSCAQALFIRDGEGVMIMKKTLALFDENIKIDLSEIKDAYEVLWNDFDNLVSKLDKKGS